jgi:hypothetical protein
VSTSIDSICMQARARIANLTRNSNCGAAQSDFLHQEEWEIVCRFEGKLRMRDVFAVDVGFSSLLPLMPPEEDGV